MIDVNGLTDEDRVRLLQTELAAIEELGSQLSDAEWDLPTDLPGWSVKDNLSHMVDYEAGAIGRPRPPEGIDVFGYAHIKNDFGRINEVGIEWRRARAGREVLAEWAEIVPIRARSLEALDQSQNAPANLTPFGSGAPLRVALMIRLMDLFTHEQDIRRATGRPGNLDGEVAMTTFAWMAQRALPRVVAARVPEGRAVRFVVGDDAFIVAVRDGKGVIADDAPPSATISCDVDVFLRLTAGRISGAQARADGAVRVDGDDTLASAILENLAVTP